MNFSHFLLLATVSIFAAQSGGTFAFQAEIAQLANGTGNNKENLEKTLTIMDAGNGMTKAGRGSIDKSGTTQAFVATNQQLLSPSEDIYFSVSPHSRLRHLSEMSNSWCSDDIEEVLLNQCYPDYDFSHTKRAAFTTVTYHECVYRHPRQNALDIDEHDDVSTEFEIVSLCLYDERPCTVCRETRLWYQIGYRAEHRQIRTQWGLNLYLKDEGCIAHAGFSLGRLLTFVSVYAHENGRLKVQRARQVIFARNGEDDFALQGLIDGQCVPLERLFPAADPPAPPVVPPAAAIDLSYRLPPKSHRQAWRLSWASMALSLCASTGMRTTSRKQQPPPNENVKQQQQQQLTNFVPEHHQQQPLVSAVVQLSIHPLRMQMPFFVNPPFLRLPLALPPLQFGQQQNQHAFAPPPAAALQIAPLDDAPAPQPLCDVVPMAPSSSRRVPRECVRAAYKLLSSDQINAAHKILFGNRPDSTMSSCSSASSSTSSFASSSAFCRASSVSKHSERD
ncbi:hypothetical protein niasHS_009931 [Heterodera schachtii]|uniref:Uncharacterized protein n=1 Tax=Heterodera schachtii TaxID=97005 RepID=A0ABD2JD21_HETSC